jgi:hypothetical protein
MTDFVHETVLCELLAEAKGTVVLFEAVFLRDILTEAEEKVAYRDLLIVKVSVRDTDCQSLCLRFLPVLFYTCYKV